MLTKRDMEREAARIKEIEDVEDAWKEMDMYCDIFGASNPRFDQNKFMEACGFWFLSKEESNEEKSREENAKF